MSSRAQAIVITDLTKRYKSAQKNALDKLSLEINSSEVYGFLGPNGAGKSTTIRLLLNFLQPTSGKMTINGTVVGADPKIYSQVGYLSGDFAGYPKLTGDEFLNYLSDLSGIDTKKQVRGLAKQLEITLDKPLASLSKGNRQKVGLIQAFMGNPSVLILDEPTSGLDPLKQEVFYEMVGEAKQRGACVFVSSHNLAEVQKMCDRVGIIRDGVLVHESTIADLELEASQTFEVTFNSKPPITELSSLKGVTKVQHNDSTVTIHTSGELSELLGFLAKYKISKLETHEIDLESEFMRYYNQEKK